MCFFFFTILWSGCKDDDQSEMPIPIYQPGAMGLGGAEGKKNQWDWKASGFGGELVANGDTFYVLSLATFSEADELRERLVLSYMPTATGTYSIAANHQNQYVTASYVTLTDGGDITEDFYNLDKTAVNEITINKIDTLEKIIEGVFTINMQIDDPANKINEINPDDVIFSNVAFSVTIIQ